MLGMRAKVLVTVLAVGTMGLGATAGAKVATGDAGTTIRVPTDAPTIQRAVDRAEPGTLILVAPGVYREAVTVAPEHRDIVIRGERRAETIVDGEFSAEPGHENGFKVFADGVAIENMTARNFVTNGFFWTGVDGYRGSYLTAVRNGDYGVYAYDSVHGQFDHSYASGSPDAGFYIGQCFPCDALIVDVESEWNGLGYSGSNSGGHLLIARSSFHDNRAGIVPNSDSSEELAPEHETTVVGNRVFDNNNVETAAIEIAVIALGNGILVGGGNENRVERNLVTGHQIAGIALVTRPEKVLDPDDPDAENYDARDNVVRDNVLSDNQYDLANLATINDLADAGGNCFAGNRFTTSLPDDLEGLLPCGRKASSSYEGPLGRFAELLLAENPPGLDFQTVALPDPGPQPDMPKAKTAKARPATDEPSIKVNPKQLRAPTGQ